jgi:hypothetical protein
MDLNQAINGQYYTIIRGLRKKTALSDERADERMRYIQRNLNDSGT